jgi:hypothetical protein
MNKATDAEQTLLADLISLWQRRRAEGQAASPAELCRDCPELLPELQRRIAAQERMGALVATRDTGTFDPDATRLTTPRKLLWSTLKPWPTRSKP